MYDRVIDAIKTGKISADNISFQYLRSLAGQDKGVWQELDRGRAILSTTDHLDQYLLSYGPKISSQWDTLLNRVHLPDGNISIIDYGCGQGLATMLVLDRFQKAISGRVSSVVLIEPSRLALERATHIVDCYLPGSNITGVNEMLDNINHSDLAAPASNVRMHLFSNILDVEGFDQYTLFSDMFRHSGRHLVLAVGNDRSQHGGSERLRTLFELMHDEAHQDWLSLHDAEIKSFRTDRDRSAIYFYVDVRVDGSF